MKPMVAVLILVIGLNTGCSRDAQDIAERQKLDFLDLIKGLPKHGEFFTDEAVEKAAPYTSVLLSLNQQDLKDYDLYPFLALSRGLVDRPQQREYGRKHFEEIRHPEIKLAWGIMLFDKQSASPEIVGFLQSKIQNNEDRRWMQSALGPGFDDFEQRLGNSSPPKTPSNN